MSSLIPGYEYDIFISYRHNDNRSGWVTEFVKNLQEELSATIKEPVSVYFDSNPHDGLLETHNVDKSLEGKLNCLIFIPIISQTYCDTKSFAWQHEFVAFNKSVKEDQFGGDIKLSNGNVASRILPVKIHDIDAEDKALLENELGGILRAIEFIYKEAGVNRPLKPIDIKNDNQNRTDYRNQVNKVANAVKEIIHALQNPQRPFLINDYYKKKSLTKRSGKIRLFAGLTAILGIAAYLVLFPNLQTTTSTMEEKSIAVLPFINLSSDEEQQYFADGVMEAIRDNLSKIKDLKVIPRTSVEQYRETSKTVLEIAKDLNVAYLLEGSAQPFEGRIRVTAQLIDARQNQQAWSKSFDRERGDIFAIQSEIAQEIAEELQAQITPEEKEKITSVPTSNLAAYDFYLRSKEYIDRYLHSRNVRDFENAVHLLREALNLDPEFALAYAYMGLVYQWNFPTNWIKNGFSMYAEPKFLDSVFVLSNKALNLDSDLAEGYWVRSWYYATKGENEKSITDLKHAIALNPDHDFYKGLGLFHAEMGEYEEAFKAYTKSFALVQHYRTIDYADVGNFYMYIGELEKAKSYDQESIKLQPDFGWGYWNLSWLAVIQGRFDEGLQFSEKVLSLYPDDHDNHLNVASILALLKRFPEAEEHLRKGISKLDERAIDSRREGGYILWMNGKEIEATERFNRLIDYGKECIRLENRYGQKRASYDLAGTYAFLGNKQEAYKWLRDYEKRGFKSGLESYILIDPLFASLKEEKEFKEILKRVQNQKATIRKEIKKLEKSGALLR